jgi:hypothetical protein
MKPPELGLESRRLLDRDSRRLEGTTDEFRRRQAEELLSRLARCKDVWRDTRNARLHSFSVSHDWIIPQRVGSLTLLPIH